MLSSLISDDEIQGIEPVEKDKFEEDGVPPPMNLPNSTNLKESHSPLNSGNLKGGTSRHFVSLIICYNIFIYNYGT